ncbi:hypothetical protein T02_6947 [Trichinella nativa]|uniref:Uncharacterized protein n=1 Tax=Trichinella nativa TaxID=6335 RepID=A0A0V1LGS2_9BILA|nr:hypothetical protein T06_12725 [Trichinella sp. T6]KRZ58709.1 hypothetical protein T02_6947 [Trichinella nativa]
MFSMRICRVPMTPSILYQQRAPREARLLLCCASMQHVRGRGVNRLTSGSACLYLLTGLAILAPFCNGNRRNTSQVSRCQTLPVKHVSSPFGYDPISNRRPEPGDYLVFSSTTSVSNFILRSASRNYVIANRPGVGYPIQSDGR